MDGFIKIALIYWAACIAICIVATLIVEWKQIRQNGIVLAGCVKKLFFLVLLAPFYAPQIIGAIGVDIIVYINNLICGKKGNQTK